MAPAPSIAAVSLPSRLSAWSHEAHQFPRQSRGQGAGQVGGHRGQARRARAAGRGAPVPGVAAASWRARSGRLRC
ncbi:hypothetical protein G6F68_020687 [Rhizopus microsporus]|uniref:Uncharacterized protein n=1 Tax=Rhizopus delemar TaxID=936053 RepID=A0A9P7C095_9FUNG|nr:hypothetical protein G6F68_020687 [Rhizopus microsporus]KAG1529696.1 hypothetical protein G6F50_017823 [Rhizopus delemar]